MDDKGTEYEDCAWMRLLRSLKVNWAISKSKAWLFRPRELWFEKGLDGPVADRVSWRDIIAIKISLVLSEDDRCQNRAGVEHVTSEVRVRGAR